MNFEHEEPEVIRIVVEACREIGVGVRTEVGEFTDDGRCHRSRVIFHYDHKFRKNRTQLISFALWFITLVYYSVVSIIKDDSAGCLPLLNVVLAAVTSVLASEQHVATSAERQLAIHIALSADGFDVVMTPESFEVFL